MRSLCHHFKVVGLLERLALSGNSLTGCAPAEWREIEDIQIDLPHCDEPLEDSPGDLDPALVSSCSNRVVIRDLENNLGLVSDCVVLLEAKEILIGSNRPGRLPEPSLNWGAEISIYEWDGVTIGGSPNQVQGLDLTEMGLTGEIPPELGRMAGLRELSLGRNELTGEIPPELARLTNLTQLWLYFNQLVGEIPPELGNLTNLQNLNLNGNWLAGEIPPELGSMTALQGLWLGDNRLTGIIPPELSNLTSLDILYLSGNRLTGCIPRPLRDIRTDSQLHFCPLD